jgi:hypothetical protein
MGWDNILEIYKKNLHHQVKITCPVFLRDKHAWCPPPGVFFLRAEGKKLYKNFSEQRHYSGNKEILY